MSDAVAAQRQQMMVSLSDDPDAWRRPPFADIYGQCLNAKYGTPEAPEEGPF